MEAFFTQSHQSHTLEDDCFLCVFFYFPSHSLTNHSFMYPQTEMAVAPPLPASTNGGRGFFFFPSSVPSVFSHCSSAQPVQLSYLRGLMTTEKSILHCVVDHFYIALFSALEKTHYNCM